MLLAILHTLKETQVGDLVRFDASKSTKIRGTVDEINSVKIKVGMAGPEIDVYGSLSKNWFLDTAVAAASFDIDETNDDVDFEVEGQKFSTNVQTGTYTLDTLLAEIKNKCETLVSSLTVSFEVGVDKRISFSSSLAMVLDPTRSPKSVLKLIGFDYKGQSKSYPVEGGVCRVTLTVASASESVVKHEYLKVFTPEGDALFSCDADLETEEPDIMKWLPDGKSSYNFLHRKAQKEILDFLDQNGYRTLTGLKINKWAIVDKLDVKLWSIYLALKIHFAGIHNAERDVFVAKSKSYGALAESAKQRVLVLFDTNNDGQPDAYTGFSQGRVFYR